MPFFAKKRGSTTSRWAANLLVTGLSLLLGGCVYFNTFYNARKAYDQAIRMKEKRLDKDPEDSVLVTNEERLKLERSIAKSSKVLELYPDKTKYQPKALFLIGESYLAMGEYAKAILKYDELQRFYPQAGEMEVAEFHRAKAYFHNGQHPFARAALEKVIAAGNPDFQEEALDYMARLEVENNSPAQALEIYEKLLKTAARSPEARANVHYEAAKLAFQIKQWERARGHARAPEIGRLPSRVRYRCDMLAAECLYELGKVGEGIAELEDMLKARLYADFAPEIHLKLAEGWFRLGKPENALELLAKVPVLAPKTAQAAEAFYLLGEHHWHKLKDESKAKEYYDSAAAAGTQFEHGALAAERSKALARLAELRKTGDTTTPKEVHYRDFMIAELFLFRLDNIDSALGRLDRIVEDPRQDSNHTMRAAYARAFIQDEFRKSKGASDSLYRYVLEKYPNTEYAKQAERNLGMRPTVQTDEDAAHRLFLEAEAQRFAGADLAATVIPAYARVVSAYPATREAARAQFAIAMLYEDLAFGEGRLPGGLDSAKAAYIALREGYPESPYTPIAAAKLDAAGIKPGIKPGVKPGASTPSPGGAPASPSAPAAKDAGPDTAAAPSQVPHGRSVPAPPDTASPSTPDNPREELETDYDNVEQY
jgi:outer membrane protein assembly factor BamD (BamD/ComL family)